MQCDLWQRVVLRGAVQHTGGDRFVGTRVVQKMTVDAHIAEQGPSGTRPMGFITRNKYKIVFKITTIASMAAHTVITI